MGTKITQLIEVPWPKRKLVVGTEKVKSSIDAESEDHYRKKIIRVYLTK